MFVAAAGGRVIGQPPIYIRQGEADQTDGLLFDSTEPLFTGQGPGRTERPYSLTIYAHVPTAVFGV